MARRPLAERKAAAQAAMDAHRARQAGTLRGLTKAGTLALAGGVIELAGRTYPAAGARAEVSDFASGLLRRRHTITVTVTLGSGEVLTWHRAATGRAAARVHRDALSWCAQLATAGRS